MRNIKQARAIYYSKQEQKYKIYEKAVNDLNMRKCLKLLKKILNVAIKIKCIIIFLKNSILTTLQF